MDSTCEVTPKLAQFFWTQLLLSCMADGYSRYRHQYFTLPITAFGRSRPAADASREVVERWLLDGLDVSVGHRRCSIVSPSSAN